MEDDWQGVGCHVPAGGKSGIPKEVENKGVERLEGCITESKNAINVISGIGLTQGVTLLDKSLEEEICSAHAVELLSSLRRRDFAQTLDGHAGVDSRNGDTGQNTGDNLRLTQRARPGSRQRKQEACQALAGLSVLCKIPSKRRSTIPLKKPPGL